MSDTAVKLGKALFSYNTYCIQRVPPINETEYDLVMKSWLYITSYTYISFRIHLFFKIQLTLNFRY